MWKVFQSSRMGALLVLAGCALFGFSAMFARVRGVFGDELEDMSHGWLVLPFSLYVLWTERDELRRSRGAPSLWGEQHQQKHRSEEDRRIVFDHETAAGQKTDREPRAPSPALFERLVKKKQQKRPETEFHHVVAQFDRFDSVEIHAEQKKRGKKRSRRGGHPPSEFPDAHQAGEHEELAEKMTAPETVSGQKTAEIADPGAEIRILVVPELKITSPDDVFGNVDKDVVQHSQRQQKPADAPECQYQQKTLPQNLFPRRRLKCGGRQFRFQTAPQS